MKTSDAAEHFGGMKAMAKALGISEQAVHKWGDYPPDARQFQIAQLSDGSLVAEPSWEREASNADAA
jgi:hypothetical protein